VITDDGLTVLASLYTLTHLSLINCNKVLYLSLSLSPLLALTVLQITYRGLAALTTLTRLTEFFLPSGKVVDYYSLTLELRNSAPSPSRKRARSSDE
jgi:hypothetical protein